MLQVEQREWSERAEAYRDDIVFVVKLGFVIIFVC